MSNTADSIPATDRTTQEIFTMGSTKGTVGSTFVVPPDAIVLNVEKLANPYRVLKKLSKTQDPVQATVDFLLNGKDRNKFLGFVDEGVDRVQSGKRLIVQCKFGQHRSRAVARVIQKRCGASKVQIVHKER